MTRSTKSLFELESILLSDRTWRVARLLVQNSKTLFETVQQQTSQKVRYTRNESQSGQIRAHEEKYQKQLMGSLAELATVALLESFLNRKKLADLWRVIHYDSVRTDGFASPIGAYDIRLQSLLDPELSYDIESRSSIAYDRSLTSGLEEFDIIGPYESSIKSGEQIVDFYIRPLYAYLDYIVSRYQPIRFSELFLSGRVMLYIVGGCTQKHILETGYNKSMGQGRTRYRVVRILDGLDIIDFLNGLSQVLEE